MRFFHFYRLGFQKCVCVVFLCFNVRMKHDVFTVDDRYKSYTLSGMFIENNTNFKF